MPAILANTNITLDNTSAINIPGTPVAGQTVLYPKADKLLYYKDDAGVERSANITLGTAVATTSGTSIDFTAIPAGVRRVTVMFRGVSVSGNSDTVVRLGTSGGVQATGYQGAIGLVQNAGASVATALSTGFAITALQTSASADMHGSLTLSLLDSSTGVWACSGVFGRTDAVIPYFVGGSKSLAGVLDRLRLTTIGGSDTFDAGSVNIMWEF